MAVVPEFLTTILTITRDDADAMADVLLDHASDYTADVVEGVRSLRRHFKGECAAVSVQYTRRSLYDGYKDMGLADDPAIINACRYFADMARLKGDALADRQGRYLEYHDSRDEEYRASI